MRCGVHPEQAASPGYGSRSDENMYFTQMCIYTCTSSKCHMHERVSNCLLIVQGPFEIN